MPLSQMKPNLRGSAATVERKNKMLSVKLGGGGPIRITLHPEKDGMIEATALVVRDKDAKDLARLPEFLAELDKMLTSDETKIGFSAERNAFTVTRTFGESNTKEEIDGLLYRSQWLASLFGRVGETGKWDTNLINLLFCDLDEMVGESGLFS